MSATIRFRDVFRQYTPVWLLDRLSDGLTTGFSYLWTMIAPLDNAVNFLAEGLQAPWPGQGTPTALNLIGRTRGIIRGQGESDASYTARLQTWLDRATRLGSAEATAKSLQDFLSTHPMVRIVNRAGFWTTLATDGTFSYTTRAWNWDTVSNPERNDPAAPYWSDEWIIIYSPPWAIRGNFGDPGQVYGQQTGKGHLVTRQEYDAILGEIARTKAAHTNVRAIVWSYDATKFDPTNPMSTMPDGTWGRWAYNNGVGPSQCRRDPSCRYWEPSRIVDPEVTA